jgi:hypothetical protein
MGIKITKEKLEKIYKDYELKKSKIPKRKPKKENINNNITDIFKKHLFKNNKKNKTTQEMKNTTVENVINVKSEKKINDEIDNILYRRHKSFEFSKKNEIKDEFILNDNKKYDNISEDDQSSENSDYIDISNEPIILNITKKKNLNNLKSIRLRNSYYSKLVYTKVWAIPKEKMVTNLFFYDWDDTLMCTSYLGLSRILDEEDSSQIDKSTLKNLDQLSSSLLSKSIENGQVFIVTNAAHGWIEYSAKKFYPLTSKLLKKVKIVSARGLYEKRLPGDYRQWKSKAFIDTVINSGIDLNKTANIICFGDSIIELEASHNLKEIFSNGYIKTIKLKENPQPSDLIKELKIISAQFDDILSNIRNLSIKVVKKKNE